MLDLIHIVLHLNLYLGELLHELGWGIYPLLFAIIFCETGLRAYVESAFYKHFL
jgi:hypothetical protein